MHAVILAALAFYGVAFDPAMTNAPTASRVFPVNFVRYKMIQPDGQIRYLHRDMDRPGVLLGEYPWVGTIRKNVISVWADPAATEGKQRTAFTFVNGQLRSLSLDGTDYRFPEGMPKLEGALESLWPEKKARTYERGSTADIWRNDTRLRLWFANPNSAGMFCAQVALLGLWLLLAGRWYRRIPGLALLSVSLYGVAQSGSRGSLLGLILGAGLVLAFSLRRRLNVKTLIATVAVLGLSIGLFAASGLAKRFTDTVTTGQVDPGNQRRITIGKAAMRMFADAPFGWHCGEVPGRNVALNWYVFDENHVIRTHLLSMAELGWFAGFGYAFFWAFALALGMAAARREDSLSVGEWAAFAAAGVFNPVYTEVSLWGLPAVATAWSLWRARKRLPLRAYAVCGAVAAIAAAATVVALVLAGRSLNADRRTSVRAYGKAVAVNGDAPSVWIVEDGPVLGGWGFPGREVLAYYSKHPEAAAVGYVADIGDLPNEVEKLVLPGRAAAEYLAAYRNNPRGICRAKKTLFLSPSVEPDKMPEELLKESQIMWLAGSFAAGRYGSGGVRGDGWFKIVPGVEQYVPNWMKIITSW